MLPTPAVRLPDTLPAPTGFGLFLAKLGGILGLWAALWAILAASTALEHPHHPPRPCHKENADVYVSLSLRPPRRPNFSLAKPGFVP